MILKISPFSSHFHDQAFDIWSSCRRTLYLQRTWWLCQQASIILDLHLTNHQLISALLYVHNYNILSSIVSVDILVKLFELYSRSVAFSSTSASVFAGLFNRSRLATSSCAELDSIIESAMPQIYCWVAIGHFNASKYRSLYMGGQNHFFINSKVRVMTGCFVMPLCAFLTEDRDCWFSIKLRGKVAASLGKKLILT